MTIKYLLGAAWASWAAIGFVKASGYGFKTWQFWVYYIPLNILVGLYAGWPV